MGPANFLVAFCVMCSIVCLTSVLVCVKLTSEYWKNSLQVKLKKGSDGNDL